MRDPLKCTKIKEKVAVDEQIKTFEVSEKQVIVHCSLDAPYGTNYRIWKTTYLLTEKGHRCPLVAWRGICLAPQWMSIPSGVAEFTLIFTGLPFTAKYVKDATEGCNIDLVLTKNTTPAGIASIYPENFNKLLPHTEDHLLNAKDPNNHHSDHAMITASVHY